MTAESATLTRRAAESETTPTMAGVDGHLVCLAAPTSLAAEQYRALAQMVVGGRRGGDTLVLAVTSARPAEGKTTTATNLACALAQAPGARVLLVDADLRRPSVARFLGGSDRHRPGLGDWLRDASVDWDAAAPSLPALPNLSVIAAGRAGSDPYALFQSPRFGEFFRTARGRYDSIVLDTPPLLPVPDCRLIAPRVDGLLLVVAAHETPRQLVEAALDAADPDKLIGIVFNGDAGPLSEYQRYYTPYYGSPERRT